MNFINSEEEILTGKEKELHLSHMKLAGIYAQGNHINLILRHYKEINTKFDNLKYLLNAIRLISAEHGNKRSKILLNNKSISTFTNAKHKSFDEHLELVGLFMSLFSSFNSKFSEIYKKTDLDFFDFKHSKIIEHVKNIKDSKQKKQYLLSINQLLISNIDILVDCYLDFLHMANLVLVRKKIDFKAIISNNINNFQNCKYSKEFTNDSLNIKMLKLANEYQKGIDLQIQGKEVLEKESTIAVDSTPITFKWKGTELQLIEIVHLLIESKVLEYKFPNANKANQGKKAVYKAIFNLFNSEMPNDPTSRAREITSKNKSIKSQKVGASTKPIEHNFHGLHKIISLYLKNFEEKPQ